MVAAAVPAHLKHDVATAARAGFADGYMIDAGADVIFGSHPRRIQPMETYRGRPIFHSLGNSVWPRLTPMTSASAVAEVTVRPDGAVTGRLLPV